MREMSVFGWWKKKKKKKFDQMCLTVERLMKGMDGWMDE